jgi:hypothetical protein
MGVAVRTPIPLLSSPLKGEGRMVNFMAIGTTFGPDSAMIIGGEPSEGRQVGVGWVGKPPCLAARAFPPVPQGGYCGSTTVEIGTA